MIVRASTLWLWCSACLPVLTGCATIVSDGRGSVTVDNRGGPTYFTVHDRKHQLIHSGVTPQQVPLDSRNRWFGPAKYYVTFAGAAQQSQIQDINASVNPWIAGNLVLGGPLGLAIDGASGAMWQLPDRVEGKVLERFAIADARLGDEIVDYHHGLVLPRELAAKARVAADPTPTIVR